MTRGTLNANGNLTVNGGDLSVAINGTLNLANGKSLTAQGGGSVTMFADQLSGTNTNYTVTGQGSSLAESGSLYLQGGSQLNVQSGVGATFGTLYAGNVLGSGTVNVGGTRSSLSAPTIGVSSPPPPSGISIH